MAGLQSPRPLGAREPCAHTSEMWDINGGYRTAKDLRLTRPENPRKSVFPEKGKEGWLGSIPGSVVGPKSGFGVANRDILVLPS